MVSRPPRRITVRPAFFCRTISRALDHDCGELHRADWIDNPSLFCNPRFTFLPFYLMPIAVLTLVVNRRWGTVAAVIGSFVGPALLSRADTDFAGVGIFIWNWIMRFVLLEIIVLLLDRVRIEAT